MKGNYLSISSVKKVSMSNGRSQVNDHYFDKVSTSSNRMIFGPNFYHQMQIIDRVIQIDEAIFSNVAEEGKK